LFIQKSFPFNFRHTFRQTASALAARHTPMHSSLPHVAMSVAARALKAPVSILGDAGHTVRADLLSGAWGCESVALSLRTGAGAIHARDSMSIPTLAKVPCTPRTYGKELALSALHCSIIGAWRIERRHRVEGKLQDSWPHRRQPDMTQQLC
jgi:hypothetical protein